MDLVQILDALETGGLLGLLILIIVGGARGWWVYGHQYREIVNDRDEWKHMALNGTELAQSAVQVAARRK